MFNIASLLERSARAHPERTAIRSHDGLTLTYREFATHARQIGNGLRDIYSMQAGDRVAIFSSNCANYLLALYGIWSAGLVAVPINCKLHSRELLYILDHSGAKLCFLGSLEADARTASEKPGVCAFFELSKIRTLISDPLPVCVDSNDLAWLFYTSGTTGRPKGVQITHENLRQMMLNYRADIDQVTPDSSLAHFAPLSHGSGLYATVFVASGACNLIPPTGSFRGENVVRSCQDHAQVSFFLAPTMIRRLLDDGSLRQLPRDKLGTIIFGGGPMYVEDLKEALTAVGACFAQIYGQGECPMTITRLTREEILCAWNDGDERVLGSVGRPFSGVEVRLSPCGDDGPAGETGEICVAGPVVMSGYWRDKDTTGETLVDGWLKTGDIGTQSADGLFTLIDRSKDVIITGGSNVYPREIEEVLLLHPAITEAAVVGLPHRDWGEVVVAFVVAIDAVNEASLLRLLEDHVAKFKRPKRFVFRKSLPKNAYGKVLKRELRDALDGFD